MTYHGYSRFYEYNGEQYTWSRECRVPRKGEVYLDNYRVFCAKDNKIKEEYDILHKVNIPELVEIIKELDSKLSGYYFDEHIKHFSD